MLQSVRIPALVHRHTRPQLRMHKPHLVEVRVPHRSHAVPLRRPRDVQLDIHPEALRRMSDLHHARYPAVILRVGPPVVSRLRHCHIGMPLDHMHMLALQQRSLQRLAQTLVRLQRHAAVVHRVLVPEEVVVVARKPHPQRIAVGVVNAARIGHHRHLPAHALADRVYGGNLLLDRRSSPRVNLEALVSHLKALLGKLRVGFRGTQPVRRTIGVICARIARQLLTVAAQQLVNRRVEQLTRKVPQRNVDRPDSHAVMLPQDHLRLPVEKFAVKRIPANQKRGDHLDLLTVRGRAANILARNASISLDVDAKKPARAAAPRLIERPRRERQVRRHILGREAVRSQLYPAYNRCLRHDSLLRPVPAEPGKDPMRGRDYYSSFQNRSSSTEYPLGTIRAFTSSIIPGCPQA